MSTTLEVKPMEVLEDIVLGDLPNYLQTLKTPLTKHVRVVIEEVEEQKPFQERDIEDFQGTAEQKAIIQRYLKADISVGKCCEELGMGIVEGRNWLHAHGIATLRGFVDPEMKRIETENYRKVAEALGIPVAEKNT